MSLSLGVPLLDSSKVVLVVVVIGGAVVGLTSRGPMDLHTSRSSPENQHHQSLHSRELLSLDGAATAPRERERRGEFILG